MSEINDWNVSAASNNSAAPNGWPETTMLIKQLNDTGREGMAVVARWHKDTNGSLASGGSADAYTLTSNRTIGTLYDGLVMAFEANHTNTTTTPTLNLNSIGATTIVKFTDKAIAGGEIKSGQKYWVVYDSSTTKWQLINTFIPPLSGNSIESDASGVYVNIYGVTQVTPAAADKIMIYDDDGGGLRGCALGDLTASALSGLTTTNDFLLYQDQASSGSGAPSYSSGAWRDVALDTEVTDTGTIGSVSSPNVTLAAGSYEFVGRVLADAAAGGGRLRARLYNTSDSAVIVQGENVHCNTNTGVVAQVMGTFTLASQKSVKLQLYPSQNITGGTALSSGEVEVFASLFLRRYAT